MKRSFNRRQLARLTLHTFRVFVFVCIIFLIRFQNETIRQRGVPVEVTVEALGNVFTSLDGVEISIDNDRVVDPSGETIGHFLCTSPQMDRVVGFSGPTNCLIGISEDNVITGVFILGSRDTDEHIQQVKNDESFLTSFEGVPVDKVNELRVDAVSGATLSSMAITQSVIQRLGGSVGSLKFDASIPIEKLRDVFPAAEIVDSETARGVRLIRDANGDVLGHVILTSPIGDNIVGYHGPTKTAVLMNSKEEVVRIVLLDSYDNEPYIRYVREDESFNNIVNGCSLLDLAELELDDGRFDGVSGATMTSQCVIESVKETAVAKLLVQGNKTWTFASSGEVRLRDIGTITVVLAAMLIGLTRLRGSKFLRLVFQLILIVYLGLINGDMLSQALIYGWSATRVPWGTATGLVFLSLAAILLPIFSRRNLYCSHICPHGALQDIARKKLPWQIKLGKRVRGWLAIVPGVLLSWCLVVAMLGLTYSLVDIEPFDAWVFRVAGLATISIAIIGIVASLFVPMAYCKFGCPTGALLNFLRFNNSSDRWNRADTLAISLLLFAVAVMVKG